ncbi:Bro-N domain-containing protein [Pseudomonas sp. PS01300]|uniref:BRO-N domain-containing protein n=1 Tax=Pseudomonas sp. PS01300 TaxID=2991436 RepID=UPI0032B84F2D
MGDNSTAVSSVIPFDFRGHSVRAVTINGDPWFVATDVCRVLDVTNTTQAMQALDEDERSMFNIGRQGQANVINESGLYTLILRCRDAVKKGSKPHAFRKWVTAEVLPAIRKHGRYEDRDNKMSTLVDDVIGVSGTNLINGVISQKVAILPVGVQRQARHKLHAILHTRFNVPRTELIPAGKLDVACEYLAAYALEGEYLPKQEGIQIAGSPRSRYLVSFDHRGEQQVREIPGDACVMTCSEMLRALVTPSGLIATTEELFDFVAAATVLLRRRSQIQAGRAAA